MLFERPLIDRGDLLDALGPIPQRAELSYRWLRKRGLISPGVSVRPRRAGALYGSAVVLSALNREAIAALRVNDLNSAREVSLEATRLEHELKDWVEAVEAVRPPDEQEDLAAPDTALWRPDHPGDRWSRRMVRHLEVHAPDLLMQLSASADALSRARVRLPPQVPLAETTLSRVWRIGRDHAELRPVNEGPNFAFLSAEVLRGGLRLGDALLVRHEEIAPGTVITTLDPAVEIAPRGSRLNDYRSVPHVGALLEEQPPKKRSEDPKPLRRVA